jgi:predicted RNA-binding Zn-ribbon protein involved in translation (DUF1610 family)
MNEQTFATRLDKWLRENTHDLLVVDDPYRCPSCNSVADEYMCLKACFGGEANVAASMNSGPWDARDWSELWRCDECGFFYVMENSNY